MSRLSSFLSQPRLPLEPPSDQFTLDQASLISQPLLRSLSLWKTAVVPTNVICLRVGRSDLL